VFNTTFNNISVISLILELCQQYSIFFSMRDITSGAGTTNFSGPPEFTPSFRVAQSLVFCVVFSRSLLVSFPLVIVFSVLL
jgi:hypothetical protein